MHYLGIWGETEEWKEANAKLGEKRRELSRQIDLSWGFEELGEKLNQFEEAKIWKATEDAKGVETITRNF